MKIILTLCVIMMANKLHPADIRKHMVHTAVHKVMAASLQEGVGGKGAS